MVNMLTLVQTNYGKYANFSTMVNKLNKFGTSVMSGSRAAMLPF